MPPRSQIDLLPEAARQELNKRLRANGYRDLIALTEWLAEEYDRKISKTALGRYSLDLKARDHSAAMVAKGLLGNPIGLEAIDLLVELGTLKVQEQRILKKLDELGYL